MVRDFKTSDYLKSIDILKEKERHRGLDLQLGRVFWKKEKPLLLLLLIRKIHKSIYSFHQYILLCVFNICAILNKYVTCNF